MAQAVRMLTSKVTIRCGSTFRNGARARVRSLMTSCSSRCPSAVSALRTVVEQQLEEIHIAGTWKSERVLRSAQAVQIDVRGHDAGLLNFCANNYLGLSSHPEVVAAGQRALERYGAGLSSVRFICGTQELHTQLEEELAAFHRREAAILFSSCFDANAALFETLLSSEDAVFSDELNHASIIDGIRLCKAAKYRYKHLDLADLEEKLKVAQSHGFRLKLVATDSVFSMDGDVAPLREICQLAEAYEALVFIDECHATGFIGATGRGVDELLGVSEKVTIINSTLGKALGGAAGGFTVGPQPVVDLLRQRARPYLFSNALPPPVTACALAALNLVDDGTLAQSIAEKTRRFRSQMSDAGFTLGGKNHPICPVMIGDAKLTSTIAEEMLDQGMFVVGFSFPVVPRGAARIRVQISAAHSNADIDECVNAFVTVGRKHGLVA
uniref:2-amino-3-ketobutyrate coenzyme A ligase, mitochondrial isoform X2 n=1 Tax=Myxine glutinosa TaxID=7769 RepID=UPI00358F5102